MEKVRAKVSEMRERATAAINDVPDNLIGTILVLVVLTVLGLGLLMFLGYMATR